MKNKINKKTETYRKYSSFYLLLLPGLIYFALFKYAPMYGVIIAFKNYSVFSGIIESDWVGFDVFKRLFSIPGFKRAFTNTITISLLKTITGFPLSIFIALLFNELTSRKGKKLLQTAIILPHFVSWVIISGLIYALLSPNVGLIKDLYIVFGISKKQLIY
jgi:putative aldouronate transport system permease protein